MDSSSSSPKSSSMSPAANHRDSLDDDGPISVTNALAKEAALQFQLRKFPDCLEVLRQLLQMKADDPKILHNIAVAENFQDGLSNPKRFLEVLSSLKRQNEELARASGEHGDAASNTGSKAIIGSKGSNSGPMNNSPSVYDDEFDVSVTMFNIAAAWYNLHEYEKSFLVLESLYQNIEPIDERVAYQVCLLLLDVALICCRASRAADVISYMERVFIGNGLSNQGDNGSFTQQQSTNLVSSSSSLPNNALVSDDSSANANGPESPLSGNLSEDTLYDSFISTFDTSGQKLARPSSDRSRTQVDESFITSDKLHLYKIWLLLLTRNLKAAKREVKMAMNVARGKDYSLALFLKSQLEYARGNHRKAIKLLMASSNRTETGTSSMYYNNLGCIYYQLGKYHTSTLFFSKALSTNSSLQKEKPLKLLTFAQDKSLLIVYNCGVTYLATGKPTLAARCFREASSVFYKRPLFWLRMAECCLMALDQESEITVHVVGKGKWRQLVIEKGDSRNGQTETVGTENIFSGDYRQQFKLSMPFARNCLSNALHLLNISESKSDSNSASEEDETRETRSKSTNSKASNPTVGPSQVNSNGEVKEQKAGNSLNASLQSSISEYEGICGKQNQTIRQAVLADMAFVELELGNPLKALSTARYLLRLPECSRLYIFLGNLYAAEALCLLNRLKEASDHLYVYVSSESNVELPFNQEDWQQWHMKKLVDTEEPHGSVPLGGGNPTSPDESQGVAFLNPDEARGTLLAELAAMSAIRGEIEEAKKLMEQALSVIPNKPEVVLTAIYVDLVCGNTQGAISRLKQCTHVRFLSSNLIAKEASSSSPSPSQS